VGWNLDGTITNCYSAGSVSGDWRVGGLVGWNLGDFGGVTISNCYSAGSVSGDWRVGGLVGSNANFGTITDCYAVGRVIGTTDVGGLVGKNLIGTVTYSFWDIQTSGQPNSDGGTGKTTAEMQDPNTFMDAGWDFVGKPDGPHDIWAEPVGGGYPILCWQLSLPPALPTFSGGTGEPDDPYLLSTREDLNRIGHNPRLMEAHFKLINDIDLTGINFFIIGSEIFRFTGIFDGNGHTISNFSYTSTDRNYIGIFGYVRGENARIKDLGLIDPNVDTGTGDNVGSLVSWLIYGTITDCYAEGGSVSGDYNVGGLVGRNSRGTITNCYSTASVSGDGSVGGLVGDNYDTITDCYARGDVAGDKHVGGLVGSNWESTITNCYASGSVSGNYWVGGLVGWNYKGSVSSSFWDIQTSGQLQLNSYDGIGKTTAEMQTESTFTDAGWDFVDETANGTDDIWWILEGQDYPRLWWEAHN
jgi:hypothetical protein